MTKRNKKIKSLIKTCLLWLLALSGVAWAVNLVVTEDDCNPDTDPLKYMYHFKAEVIYNSGEEQIITKKSLGRASDDSHYHPTYDFSNDCVSWTWYECVDGNLVRKHRTIGCGIKEYRVIHFYKNDLEKEER